MSGFTVLDLGKLAKPATVLVEKVCNAVGVIYGPTGIRRTAVAEADARMIAAKTELDISDMQQRALQRLVHQEGRKQANIESITSQAIHALPHDAEPESLDEDWVAHFFKQCDTVSDTDMQLLWARLLSGEATRPGSFSKRTVDCVAAFDKSDAELFTKLSQFVWCFGSTSEPLIYDVTNAIYAEQGITFDALDHLSHIGLVRDAEIGFTKTWKGQQGLLTYQGTEYLLATAAAPQLRLSIGTCLLTSSGRQLIPICGAMPNSDFCNYVQTKWRQQGLQVSRSPSATP